MKNQFNYISKLGLRAKASPSSQRWDVDQQLKAHMKEHGEKAQPENPTALAQTATKISLYRTVPSLD